jgi:hypothetical protein
VEGDHSQAVAAPSSDPYDGIDFVQAAHDAAERDVRYRADVAVFHREQTAKRANSPDRDANWNGEFGLNVHADGTTSSWVKSDTHPHLNYDTRKVSPDHDAQEHIDSVQAVLDGDDGQDPALQARPHRERIDDLVTRADAATSRLDMHMEGLDALGKRLAAIERKVEVVHIYGTLPAKTEAAFERIARIEHRHRKLRKQHRHDHRWLRTLAKDMASVTDLVDAITFTAPTAEREPGAVPVVTDEMCRAYLFAYGDAICNGPEGTDPIAVGLAAALKAGGAK